jgi:2'-5' RNA ligase
MMNQMKERRTFVAVPLPSVLQDLLGEWMENNQHDLPFHKWVHKRDLHITLHFLGRTTQEQMVQTIDALKKQAENQVPFKLSIAKFGTFGRTDQPRIFWAGIEGELNQLQRLQTLVTNTLVPIGFSAESRPYHSHVTLARKYKSNDFKAGWLTEIQIPESTWVVDRFVLYETIAGSIPMYHILETFPLS